MAGRVGRTSSSLRSHNGRVEPIHAPMPRRPSHAVWCGAEGKSPTLAAHVVPPCLRSKLQDRALRIGAGRLTGGMRRAKSAPRTYTHQLAEVVRKLGCENCMLQPALPRVLPV